MKKSLVLKTFALLFIFGISFNAANAQKTDKKDKSGIQVKETKTDEKETKEEEKSYIWIYSVATITDMGGKYDINFEEAKNPTRESKTNARSAMMIQSKQVSQKMSSAQDMFLTETDILNFLADQNYEVISIVPVPGKEGKVMKYYFKSKVEVLN